MGDVDLWACVASAVAAGALAIRAHMLKPHHNVWAGAPWPVWVGLVGLAIALGMSSVSIANGAHATAREAMIYTVLAVTACIMLWNLDRHGRAFDLKTMLQGRATIVTTMEPRDPEAVEIFARAAARKRGLG